MPSPRSFFQLQFVMESESVAQTVRIDSLVIEHSIPPAAAVFGEKPSQRMVEEMQLLLDNVKRDIAVKENRAREKEVQMGRQVETLRKGLMAGSGDMSATGFYVGGEPC